MTIEVIMTPTMHNSLGFGGRQDAIWGKANVGGKNIITLWSIMVNKKSKWWKISVEA